MAFDNQDNVLFASDGMTVIRINGNLIKVAETNGRIGGNAVHSAEDDITVTFRERPGKKVYLEEGVSTPMTMTVLNGRAEASVPVMRSCGA